MPTAAAAMARREQALGYPSTSSPSSTSNRAVSGQPMRDRLAFTLPSFTEIGFADVPRPDERPPALVVRKLQTVQPDAKLLQEGEVEGIHAGQKSLDGVKVNQYGLTLTIRISFSGVLLMLDRQLDIDHNITPPSTHPLHIPSPTPTPRPPTFETWLPDDSLLCINPDLLSEAQKERVRMGRRTRARGRARSQSHSHSVAGDDPEPVPTEGRRSQSHTRARVSPPSKGMAQQTHPPLERYRQPPSASAPAHPRPQRPPLVYRPRTTDFHLLRQVKANNLTLPSTSTPAPTSVARPSLSAALYRKQQVEQGPPPFRPMPRPLPSPFTTRPLVRAHPYPCSTTRDTPVRSRTQIRPLAVQPSTTKKIHPPPPPPVATQESSYPSVLQPYEPATATTPGRY